MKMLLIVNKYFAALILGALILSAGAQTKTNAPKARVVSPAAPPAAQPIKPKTIRIREITGDFGFKKCMTDAGELFIAKLPPEVIGHFTALRAAETEVERWKDQTLRGGKSARSEAGKSSGPQLRAATLKLKEVQLNTPKFAPVMALETAQVYGGLKVWQFVSRAPK